MMLGREVEGLMVAEKRAAGSGAAVSKGGGASHYVFY